MARQIAPELLTAQQTAEYLGYRNFRSVAALIDEGHLDVRPYSRNGRTVYKRSELDRYIDNLPEVERDTRPRPRQSAA